MPAPLVARLIPAAVLALACHGALAQTEGNSIVPAPLAVQRLAPQLVAFAGSDANFQSLVNGLAAGTPVQLSTTLTNGFTQSVTFTPVAAASPVQIAQMLEAARQQLIGMGIGTPTSEQIGFTLMGGLVPTPLGGTQASGLANGAAAGATAPSAAPSPSQVTSNVTVQTTPTPAASPAATARRQTSDSLSAPGATSRSTAPITSASPVLNTSASPAPVTPTIAPGAGSVPGTAERLPAGRRPALN